MSGGPFANPGLPLVDRANRGLRRAWEQGLLTKPPIDAPALITRAERRERGTLAPGQWATALDSLTADLEHSAALNPLGRAMAHGQLVDILRQRIRAARLWRDHPEIHEIPIERPVVILGQMRSGTTLMHRLLACDPNFCFTRLHETLWPLARSASSAAVKAAVVKTSLGLFNPQLRSAHPTAAQAPEEEFGLLAFSIHGAMFEAQWNVPDFAGWSERRELSSVYREFRSLLQTLRWRRRDRATTIQLLKAPQFMQELEPLLEAFPDARIIMLTRDPNAVMASSASLVWHQRRIQSDEADPLRIGIEWRRKTLLRQKRALSVLSHLPSAQWIGIEFERLMSDWRGEVARIYNHLELATSPELLERMSRIASARSHYGHRYSSAQFGLQE